MDAGDARAQRIAKASGVLAGLLLLAAMLVTSAFGPAPVETTASAREIAVLSSPLGWLLDRSIRMRIAAVAFSIWGVVAYQRCTDWRARGWPRPYASAAAHARGDALAVLLVPGELLLDLGYGRFARTGEKRGEAAGAVLAHVAVLELGLAQKPSSLPQIPHSFFSRNLSKSPMVGSFPTRSFPHLLWWGRSLREPRPCGSVRARNWDVCPIFSAARVYKTWRQGYSAPSPAPPRSYMTCGELVIISNALIR